MRHWQREGRKPGAKPEYLPWTVAAGHDTGIGTGLAEGAREYGPLPQVWERLFLRPEHSRRSIRKAGARTCPCGKKKGCFMIPAHRGAAGAPCCWPGSGSVPCRWPVCQGLCPSPWAMRCGPWEPCRGSALRRTTASSWWWARSVWRACCWACSAEARWPWPGWPCRACCAIPWPIPSPWASRRAPPAGPVSPSRWAAVWACGPVVWPRAFPRRPRSPLRPCWVRCWLWQRAGQLPARDRHPGRHRRGGLSGRCGGPGQGPQ